MISVGMISAVREDVELTQSFVHLRYGGFDGVVHRFCEPGVPAVELASEVVRHDNEVQRGVLGNWVHCCRWLVENTSSDYVLVCEDDVAYCRGAKQALCNLLFQHHAFGFASLYTARGESERLSQRTGWIEYNRGWSTYGSQALCFPRPSAVAMLGEAPLHSYDQLSGPTDAIVAQYFQNKGFPCYHHSPSLADHVGRQSTVGHSWSTDHTGLNFDPGFRP
jgi:hypothetical protein